MTRCELGVETHGNSCEEDFAQPAVYSVTIGIGSPRDLCSICAGKVTEDGIGMLETVHAVRLAVTS